jgi:ATP-binding cassette subfamily G (WHITE) protein 2 (SNQ2)
VLGRPGSGCSTFLKVIANTRESYAEVTGEVAYGGISSEEVAKRHRGEVVYNEEDDQHLPNLTVGQTLKFSLLNKAKARSRRCRGHSRRADEDVRHFASSEHHCRQ